MDIKTQKLQNITDIIGKHWNASGLSSNKIKENNAAIIILDHFYESIIKNNAIYNENLLKNALKSPTNPFNYVTINTLLSGPLMSFERNKALMCNQIHQNFMESSLETEGYTTEKCMDNERHSINLKNLISYKMISSSTLYQNLLQGWKSDYFERLQQNPDYLINISKNNPQEFIMFLESVDALYEKFIMQVRGTIERSYTYILPRKNTFVTDIGAYFLNFNHLNVPLDKIKSVMPFEASHQEFLDKVIYSPISSTHSAITIPFSETFKVTFNSNFKHLIQVFLESDLPDYIGFTNSFVSIVPLGELSEFRKTTLNLITMNRFDLMLMSRALATLARRNIDAMIEYSQIKTSL